MVYKGFTGKGYVRGYEVEFTRPKIMDVDKPRSVKTAKNQSINFGFGPSFELNNVTGSPTLGFNNSNTISLRSERVGSEKRPNLALFHTQQVQQLVQIELLMLVMLVLLVQK